MSGAVDTRVSANEIDVQLQNNNDRRRISLIRTQLELLFSLDVDVETSGVT